MRLARGVLQTGSMEEARASPSACGVGKDLLDQSRPLVPGRRGAAASGHVGAAVPEQDHQPTAAMEEGHHARAGEGGEAIAVPPRRRGEGGRSHGLSSLSDYYACI